MKYKTFPLVLAILLFSAIVISCSEEEEENNFTINGTVKNSKAVKIYLDEIPITTMQPRVVDSAELNKKGRFTFGTNPIEESIFQLRIGKNSFPLASVINDVSKITLEASFGPESDEFTEDYQVKGSPASIQLKEFMQGFDLRMKEIYFKDRKIDSISKTSPDQNILLGLIAERNKLATDFKDFAIQTVNKSQSPVLSMYALSYYQTTANQNPQLRIEAIDMNAISSLVNEINSRSPMHQGVASIKKMVDDQMRKVSGLIGNVAPEIELADTKGEQVKLSSFRGKYVLVDFWASWCRPCRVENPNVVKAYNNYKKKNFTIVGVSLDQDRNAWLKAINDDGLAWTHISDLKAWGSVVVPMYGIQGIPFNVLVDPEGKIIAQNLIGKRLEDKLEEVLR